MNQKTTGSGKYPAAGNFIALQCSAGGAARGEKRGKIQDMGLQWVEGNDMIM